MTVTDLTPRLRASTQANLRDLRAQARARFTESQDLLAASEVAYREAVRLEHRADAISDRLLAMDLEGL